ncbi:hypothetical protein J437_LFUL002074 [Ladona fulva]|uniref:Uncharacterized protein n=1 Tax=Ladona fulva TaxID=123851 RepID=A0A8K0JZK1_LADFU|nr:hypothetical protein J437_LFUL002074 [Ladona fulva]
MNFGRPKIDTNLERDLFAIFSYKIRFQGDRCERHRQDKARAFLVIKRPENHPPDANSILPEPLLGESLLDPPPWERRGPVHGPGHLPLPPSSIRTALPVNMPFLRDTPFAGKNITSHHTGTPRALKNNVRVASKLRGIGRTCTSSGLFASAGGMAFNPFDAFHASPQPPFLPPRLPFSRTTRSLPGNTMVFSLLPLNSPLIHHRHTLSLCLSPPRCLHSFELFTS